MFICLKQVLLLFCPRNLNDLYAAYLTHTCICLPLYCGFLLERGTFEVMLLIVRKCAKAKQSYGLGKLWSTSLSKQAPTERSSGMWAEAGWRRRRGDECSFLAAGRAETPARKAPQHSPQKERQIKNSETFGLEPELRSFISLIMLTVWVVCVYILHIHVSLEH